jgi:DNA-directed RNA polymerase specialized sigma24 family protein
MTNEILTLIAKKHDTWVEIVQTFGCTKRIAEDITQEMYIKIHTGLEKGILNIMYKDEINYYYIFKTLKTLFLDLKRKSKGIEIIDLEEHISNFGDTYSSLYTYNDVNYTDTYKKITDELKKMHWYDRRVFEIINGGEKIAEFSRQSKITYYALYFTHKKVKDKLKKLL